MAYFEKYFEEINIQLKKVNTEDLKKVVKLINEAAVSGGKIIIVGNGGSAAMASHVAVDLTKAAGIRAVTFNESGLITCFANDYGYEKWVEKGIDFYADQNDVIFLISSSGKSMNIINAGLRAKERFLKIVTLSGFDKKNPLKSIGDINLWVDSQNYNVVEMVHHIWLLAVVDRIAKDKA